MMILSYSHSTLTSWHLNSGITMQAIDTTVYFREMRNVMGEMRRML